MMDGSCGPGPKSGRDWTLGGERLPPGPRGPSWPCQWWPDVARGSWPNTSHVLNVSVLFVRFGSLRVLSCFILSYLVLLDFVLSLLYASFPSFLAFLASFLCFLFFSSLSHCIHMHITLTWHVSFPGAKRENKS